MGTLRDDLCEAGLELVETHISWVFLGERDVWKVKKPVALGFLDFTTPDKRKAACQAEVRLNRRLAPGVYRGVVPITRDARGQHHIARLGQTVDWAVHMVRLPHADRADVRLEDGRLDNHHIEVFAQTIAAFHEEATSDADTARFGTVDVIGGNVRENFEQTRDVILEYVSGSEAREIEEWQCRFLDQQAHLFQERARAGRVRDGHGDLRLQQIYCDDAGAVTILDCIEFNERFRYADVCADVAFLSMDLTWHGRADLAELLLARYARFANDFDLYRLVDFYESYRAYVRGKVATMLAADHSAHFRTRERAGQEARRYFTLALASERRSLLPPVVVAVGGQLAAGKSTIADLIGIEIAAPVVDSDRTRKALMGVEPTEPLHEAPWQGAYAPEVSARVYDELFRRASAVVSSGRSVILDASFRTKALRARARAFAQQAGAPFHFIECRATAELAKARLRVRAEHAGVSDGRIEIYGDFIARWEAVDELPETEHVVLDTARPLEQTVATVRRLLPTWPVGLAGRTS